MPTWTFQFGCQMGPFNGCQLTHPLGFKDGTPWKMAFFQGRSSTYEGIQLEYSGHVLNYPPWN